MRSWAQRGSAARVPAGFALGLVFMKILLDRWPCWSHSRSGRASRAPSRDRRRGRLDRPGAPTIGFVAFYAAVKRMDPTRASVWVFLVPLIAVLIEVARGDVPKPVVVLGMALALLRRALRARSLERCSSGTIWTSTTLTPTTRTAYAHHDPGGRHGEAASDRDRPAAGRACSLSGRRRGPLVRPRAGASVAIERARTSR